MDTEKIKILRSKITIPIDIAIKILQENSNDVELCVQKFHRNNINTICRLAECNDTIAEKYYSICKYDIEKAIIKIHEQLFYLTTKPDEPIDKIGFVIWDENESLNEYETSRDRSLFIQAKDFEYIIDIIRSVYPIYDYDTKKVEDGFDIYGHNKFDNKIRKQIVNKISRIETNDLNVELFLRELIKWLNTKLRYANKIIIYGNL